MVSFATKAVVAFFALAQVVVAQYSITSPTDGTIWQEGQTNYITWLRTNSSSPKEVTTTIQLLEGPATALQLKLTLNANEDPDSLNYTWAIPTTLTPNSDYCISIGNPPNVSYSHFFGIAAQGQTTVPIASSAAASSAAASASSSNVYTSPSVLSFIPVSSAAPASTASTPASGASSAAPSAAAKSGAEVLRVGASMLALVPAAFVAMYFL